MLLTEQTAQMRFAFLVEAVQSGIIAKLLIFIEKTAIFLIK
jgi:hypothetical protein